MRIDVTLLHALLFAIPLLLGACAGIDTPPEDAEPEAGRAAAEDLYLHSYAEPDEVAVEHLDLDVTVDFDARQLRGRASLGLDNKTGAEQVILDTRDLTIERVTLGDGSEAEWSLGEAESAVMGRPLVVQLPPDTETIHVDYATSPQAAALQWLSPAQTDSGKPFLFTQSQAILARTWIPLQDTPAVRFTYEARVKVPADLLAVMSAENPTAKTADGVYRFEMPQPIPSYLMALAVGDLEFRSVGPEAGVYAEPQVVEAAAWEFADMQKMIDVSEELYGPYRWGRYDVLVLPPSFPFGGMENPRLTFATPTILAGDRSLVALIAHELAHSWSGNLVTNANWNDFWLNEGFTVYFERRIMEALFGRPYSEMLAALGLQDVQGTIADLEPPDTHLKLSLAGRDPDEGMTDVAYEKGYSFLRMLEEAVGRERFDAFLADYFDRYAFQSMTTEGFLEVLKRDLLTAEQYEELAVERWVYGPGLPDNAPKPSPAAFEQVEAQIAAWEAGTPAADLDTEEWTTHQWLHFLRNLPDGLSIERMGRLDQAFGFTDTGNSEVLAAWLERAIANDYAAAYGALEDFLTRQGRRKFLKPLYEALAETPEGRELAIRIYRRARPGYHSVSSNTIDEILEWDEASEG